MSNCPPEARQPALASHPRVLRSSQRAWVAVAVAICFPLLGDVAAAPGTPPGRPLPPGHPPIAETMPTVDATQAGRPLPVVTPLTPSDLRPGGKPTSGPTQAALEGQPANGTSTTALRVPGPLSARNASYRIRASLDPVKHQVTATGTLVWRNLERQPADRLVLHLYQNAFKTFATTFIREAGAQLRGDEMPRGQYGAIDVTKLKINGQELLAKAMVLDTLLSVPLPVPVGPSATVEVELGWTVQLPGTFARSGYKGDFHAVTQWFPKIGVFECDATPSAPAAPSPPATASPAATATATATAKPACRWRAHQYHGFTEFFADWGAYEVDLEVPAGFEIAATGVRVSESREGGLHKARYVAEDVHDFAWFADSQFRPVRERIDDEWGSVDVLLMSRPGQEIHNPRHLSAVRASLLEAERRLGVYPYRGITIIVPPADANGAGGMEYPTLITAFAWPLPEGFHAMELVTAHEFSHQYFYHLVGSDEVEEAWLDEGLTETLSQWGMERLFPGGCSLVRMPYLCLTQIDEAWLSSRRASGYAPLSTRSFELPGMLYGGMTYYSTAASLRTLERYLGPERMMTAMRRYVDRYRFRHPRASDFMAAMNEGAGEDLGWFFSQMVQTSRTADYAVVRIHNEPRELASGLWDCPPRPLPSVEGMEAPLSHDAQRQADLAELWQKSQDAACAGKPSGRHVFEFKAKDNEPRLYDSVVFIHRRGSFIFPVDIEIELADHTKQHEQWSLAEQLAAPEQRYKIIRLFRSSSKVARVEVDPNQQLVLDRERLNNGLLAEPDRSATRRLWLSWQGAVQTLMDLVSL